MSERSELIIVTASLVFTGAAFRSASRTGYKSMVHQ